MKKLMIAGSAALVLGLASASAAPIRAPALGDAIGSQTTNVQMMDRHEGMRGRMMMRDRMMMRKRMMMRHDMMRHRMMRHRMMHRM